jgi:hypothetical protein
MEKPMLNLNKEIVEKLKSAFSVQGMPLIKSDKFSDDLIAQLKKDSKAHASHWTHLEKNSKVWTDDEIWDQYLFFITLSNIQDDKLSKEVEAIYSTFDYVDEKTDNKVFIEKVNKVFGINSSTIFDTTFWSKFGSAPYTIKGITNKDLINANKRFGTVGMNEIFENGEFSKYQIIRHYNSTMSYFSATWKAKKVIYDLEKQNFSSPFKDLQEMEDNVVVKKIKDEARKYYLDKSKPLQERIKVFSAHGNKETSIFRPIDKYLCVIFDLYCEQDWIQRHETASTTYIIDKWIYNLTDNRIEIDRTNKYHPALKTTKRNYTPSEKAIERLNYFYMSRLFLEGVSEFEFDW